MSNNKAIKAILQQMEPINKELHSLRSSAMKYSDRERELDGQYNELQNKLKKLLNEEGGE